MVAFYLHGRASDARTHPGGNFFLPRLATRDAAQAEALLAVYCGRLCEWGLRTFAADSPEARVLGELQALDLLLRSSAAAHEAGCSSAEAEEHAAGVLALTREVVHAKDRVFGFRLSFEHDGHVYCVAEVAQVLHSTALATMLEQFLAS
jgi:hypothetical protein